MKFNRFLITIIVLSCICIATLTFYLKFRPRLASFEGKLSTDYFPLDEMIHSHGGKAMGVEGVGDFGIAYTLEFKKSDGTTETLFLANQNGKVFGNNTKPEGKILSGLEVGDYIRVRGYAYFFRGPTWWGIKEYKIYRILKIESVEHINNSTTS